MTTKKKTKKKAKAKKKTSNKINNKENDPLSRLDTEYSQLVDVVIPKFIEPIEPRLLPVTQPPETTKKFKTLQEIMVSKPQPPHKRIWRAIKCFFSRWIPTGQGVKFWFQRFWRGWDDSELWNLDKTIANHVLPRLKRFRELTCTYPGNDDFKTHEEWEEALDKMIYAMEVYAYGVTELEIEDVEWEVVSEGLQLFGKHFGYLWW